MNKMTFNKKISAAFTIALAFLCGAQCIVVKFEDCGSKIGKVSQVIITPCKVAPCALVKGTNVSIEVRFTPVKDVTHVQASLKGIIFGAPIPFPIPHPRPCGLEESELKCPLKPDQPQVYQLMLPVKTAYPKLKLEAQLSLTDYDTKDVIFCVMMPVQITDPASKHVVY